MIDCVTSEMINEQLNSKQSRIFAFVDLIQTSNVMDNVMDE